MTAADEHPRGLGVSCRPASARLCSREPTGALRVRDMSIGFRQRAGAAELAAFVFHKTRGQPAVHEDLGILQGGAGQRTPCLRTEVLSRSRVVDRPLQRCPDDPQLLIAADGPSFDSARRTHPRALRRMSKNGCAAGRVPASVAFRRVNVADGPFRHLSLRSLSLPDALYGSIAPTKRLLCARRCGILSGIACWPDDTSRGSSGPFRSGRDFWQAPH